MAIRDICRKYWFPEIPYLWRNSRQLAKKMIKLGDLFTGETLNFGSRMTHFSIPRSLNNLEIDLTRIKAGNVRDIIRTAVRLGRIDNPDLKNAIETEIRRLITEVRNEVGYYTDADARERAAYPLFGIPQFIRVLQLDASLAAEIEELLSRTPPWQRNRVSPDKWPQLADNIVFDLERCQPLAPDEVRWLFSTEGVGLNSIPKTSTGANRITILERIKQETLALGATSDKPLKIIIKKDLLASPPCPWIIYVNFRGLATPIEIDLSAAARAA